jgi:hypothetical protein
MNWTVKKKVNFVNSSQNEGLSPSGIALSFGEFGSILWHSVWFSSDGSFSFRISNFFDLSITEETRVVEMRFWCIKIVKVLVLHYRYSYDTDIFIIFITLLDFKMYNCTCVFNIFGFEYLNGCFHVWFIFFSNYQHVQSLFYWGGGV